MEALLISAFRPSSKDNPENNKLCSSAILSGRTSSRELLQIILGRLGSLFGWRDHGQSPASCQSRGISCAVVEHACVRSLSLSLSLALYIGRCIYIYICMYVHVCNTYMHTCVYIHMYIYISLSLSRHIHLYIHPYVHACIHTCMHTHMHACIRVYMHLCICMHTPIGLPPQIHLRHACQCFSIRQRVQTAKLNKHVLEFASASHTVNQISCVLLWRCATWKPIEHAFMSMWWDPRSKTRDFRYLPTQSWTLFPAGLKFNPISNRCFGDPRPSWINSPIDILFAFNRG